MQKKNSKADFIEVQEFYFGNVGASVKNTILKTAIQVIFSDRVKKKDFAFESFFLTFKETESPWYTNFLNGFFRKIKVKCFFTKGNDMFIVYFVPGNPHPRSFIEVPKKTEEYVKVRGERWKEDKDWKIDESSVKKTETPDSFVLDYRGEYEKEGKTFTVLEHTVFEGVDKVILQAFIEKNGNPKVLSDVQKIAQSIKMIRI